MQEPGDGLGKSGSGVVQVAVVVVLRGLLGVGGGGLVAGGSMVWGLFSPFFAVGDLWAMSGIRGWVPHLPGVILLVGFSGTLLVILLSTWSGIAICGCSVS